MGLRARGRSAIIIKVRRTSIYPSDGGRKCIINSFYQCHYFYCDGRNKQFFDCCIKYNFHHLDLGKTSVICSADAFLKKIILFSHVKENAI